MAFIVALVTQYDDFRDSNKELLCRDSSASTAEAVENTVDIREVLPDELADAGVVGQSFIHTVAGFIARDWPFDAAVIDEGPGYMRDLRLQNEGYIFVEDGNCIGPSHGQSG